MSDTKTKVSSNKRRQLDTVVDSNQKKRKRVESDLGQHSNDPTKASTPPATLQASTNSHKPLHSSPVANQEIKPDKKKRKNKQRGKKGRCVLPLEKIRIGFYAWHCPVVRGSKHSPRKCRILEVTTDQQDYYPVRIEYLNEIITIKRESVRLVSGWTKPEYLEFEDKYKDFTITKGLQCWHLPVYKGVVLPPQQCVVSEIDNDDPVKNISITYTESEALVFGKMITFREGWINDRDLQFDCNKVTANQNFRVLEKLMELDRMEMTKMCLKAEATAPAEDSFSTPKKNQFHIGATAYHRAMIEGEETRPLEITVMERDDEGTPRNCRIAYKEHEIEVGGQTHRLIGGWVSDTTLTPRATVWMHCCMTGNERKPREVKIMDIDTRDSEVCIEYIHHKGKPQPTNEILGGWIPALDLIEMDVKEARLLRRGKR